MSNLNNTQRRLAEGISAWLLFEFNCQRGNLFSEKYLANPVGQILTGIYPGQVKAEVNHPHIQNSGAGRPPQIDFVVKENNIWKSAVESKWITATDVHFKTIIWDLIRLEQIAYHAPAQHPCDCIFILAGFGKKMASVLGNTHYLEPESHAAGMLTYRSSQNITLDLTTLDNTTKGFINGKIRKYNLTVPRKLKCNYPHIGKLVNVNMGFDTHVWKVNSYSHLQRVNAI
jgi:hypothetical protein